MRQLLALFFAPIVLALTVAMVGRGGLSPTPPPAPVAMVPPPDWLPPTWMHGPDSLAVSGLSVQGPAAGPRLRSRAALVYDIDANEVLYEKGADERWPVASLTKVVSALALASARPDLEGTVCIGAEHYPTRSGARSKLHTGDCTTGWDLLGAALVASDNRAAYGLATVAGLDLDTFIGRMNTVSQQLGMTQSSWTEPSGLEDDNLSTARDVARATLALSTVPTLSPTTAAPFWDIHRQKRPVRRLFMTNLLGQRDDLEFVVAKTGYTDTARYCFTSLVVLPSGQRLVITLLRASGKQSRWADMRRVLGWLDG